MVERVEVKDVRVPEQLQRAMAAEAEAAREARAKVIAAEGEHKASRALHQAAEVIMDSPAALQVKMAKSFRVGRYLHANNARTAGLRLSCQTLHTIRLRSVANLNQTRLSFHTFQQNTNNN